VSALLVSRSRRTRSSRSEGRRQIATRWPRRRAAPHPGAAQACRQRHQAH
jgi:hypothetical protein